MVPLQWVLVACVFLSAQTLLAARPPPVMKQTDTANLPPHSPSTPSPPPPPEVQDFMILRPVSSKKDIAGSFNADGSGGMHRLLTWNADPKDADHSWRSFGSFGSTNSNPDEVLRAHPMSWARPSNARVARSPLGYDWVWNSQDSGAYHTGSLWRPRCPAGYSSLGDVMVWGWESPEVSGAGLERVWCVISSCTEQCREQGSWVWDTTDVGGRNSMQLYGVGSYSDGLGTMRGQAAAWPAPRDPAQQLCLKTQCKKTIGLKKIQVLEFTPEQVKIDADAKEVTVDVYDYTPVENDSGETITQHTTFKKSFTDTVRNEYSERISTGYEYSMEVSAQIGFFGLVEGDVKSSYKGTVGYEQGFLQVRGEDSTWAYEKTVDIPVGPHSNSASSITWKQASNVKIPYTALSEVQAVDYVTGDVVYNQDDVKSLLLSSGFAGQFGKWYINADGYPTLQLINHGHLSANFASEVAVVNQCTPRAGYPDACK